MRRPRRRNSRQTQNTAQAINHDHGARPSFLLVELLHFIMAESCAVCRVVIELDRENFAKRSLRCTRELLERARIHP